MTVTWLAGKTKLEPSLELISVSSLQDQHRSSWHTNKGEERNQPVKRPWEIYNSYLADTYIVIEHSTIGWVISGGQKVDGEECCGSSRTWAQTSSVISRPGPSGRSQSKYNWDITVHSPYVRQALSLLSLAWITPWNGWEVFNLTWKERNVNIN